MLTLRIVIISDGLSAFLQEVAEQRRMLLPYTIRPDRCLHFLRPGRLGRIQKGPNDWGWGIVLAVRQSTPTAAKQVGRPLQHTTVGP